MKVTLNHIAGLCVIAAVGVMCTALATHAEAESLAAASGLALLLANTAGTIVGRTKGGSS